MNSNYRILELFTLFFQGKKINIPDVLSHYHISKRTLQRDFSTINQVLETHNQEKKIIYCSSSDSYQLESTDSFTIEELLIICKILLASRALVKDELSRIINHLLEDLSLESRKFVLQFLSNELLDYYPLKHQESLIQSVHNFSQYISNQTVITFYYRKNRGQQVKNTGLPVSLYFSEYYFYVLIYHNEHENYRIYRLDRFENISKLTKKIKIPYKNRLLDSDLRKKLYFMYAGKETTFTFRFWGIPEAALDKLPESKIIKTFDDNSALIQATAYDTGVMMWLLSQGKNVQVLSPTSFVKKITNEINQMMKRYDVT